MIYQDLLPAGQVYTFDGFGDNDNYPAIPAVIDTEEESPLLVDMMQVWLGQNHFVLLAQSSFPQLDRVSSHALVYENDVEACVRWITLMANFQTKFDITLQYEGATGFRNTRPVWADFPAFVEIVKLVFTYDMLVTVNGHRASNQPAVAANYRGVDVRFVNYTTEQADLLRLIEIGNHARQQHWSLADLERKLASWLDAHHWHSTNPKLWKAIKHIRLPCNIQAYLGPYNLLFKEPNAARVALQAVNMGQEPDVSSFDRVWRLSLGISLGSWKQSLKEQFETLRRKLKWTYDEDPLRCHVPNLGHARVFGLFGDDDLREDVRRGFFRRHYLRMRCPRSPDNIIFGFDKIWELAENTSGELYRTEVHLDMLELLTDNALQAFGLYIGRHQLSRQHRRG